MTLNWVPQSNYTRLISIIPLVHIQCHFSLWPSHISRVLFLVNSWWKHAKATTFFKWISPLQKCNPKFALGPYGRRVLQFCHDVDPLPSPPTFASSFWDKEVPMNKIFAEHKDLALIGCCNLFKTFVRKLGSSHHTKNIFSVVQAIHGINPHWSARNCWVTSGKGVTWHLLLP